MAASYPSSVKSFSTKTDGSSIIMASHVNDLQLEVAAVETELLTAVSDYSSTSTIVGWTSYTTKSIRYRLLFGKLYWVQFLIEGTSNSTTTSFTLPVTSEAGYTQGVAIAATDNTASVTNAVAMVSGSSNLVVCYKALSGGSWTASGTKGIFGQFILKAA